MIDTGISSSSALTGFDLAIQQELELFANELDERFPGNNATVQTRRLAMIEEETRLRTSLNLMTDELDPSSDQLDSIDGYMRLSHFLPMHNVRPELDYELKYPKPNVMRLTLVI